MQALLKIILILSLNIIIMSINGKTKIMLSVFSGRQNPTIELDEEQYSELKSLLTESNRQPDVVRSLGYTGFIIPEHDIFISGYPEAELYLLDLFKDKIDSEIYDRVLEQINKDYNNHSSK
jgi:hypothetical protein